MNWRPIVLVALLMMVWACFAYAVNAWLRSEQRRCSKFNDLAAECLAPQTLAATLLTIVFVIASGTLLWLALRR